MLLKMIAWLLILFEPKQRRPEMWFTLYLHIRVEWVGTATPQKAMPPARHMARFSETFETVEEFRCYSQNDAELILRQTQNIYCGPNRITMIRSVNREEYSQIESRLISECVELDKLEELFV